MTKNDTNQNHATLLYTCSILYELSFGQRLKHGTSGQIGPESIQFL